MSQGLQAAVALAEGAAWSNNVSAGHERHRFCQERFGSFLTGDGPAWPHGMGRRAASSSPTPDSLWLQESKFQAWHEQFRTKIALAIELVEEVIRHKLPFGVVVFDAWYLAEDVIQALARRRQAWISLLKKNRLLETASFHLRDVNDWAIKLPGPHLAVEDLVPLILAHAYRPVKVREHTYGCFTLAVRISGLGKVRTVVSFEHEQLTGRSLVLVTNRVNWSAAKIIGLYWQRWPTETLTVSKA